jgi:hypothetical protein
MTLATLKGRLQTKALTYLLLTTITIPFWFLGGDQFWQLWAVAIGVGLVLEFLWGWLICHQPGWATFVLGAVEFGVIASLAEMLSVPVRLSGAIAYYLIAWILIQLFLLYLMPVLKIDWAQNGRELW